MIQSVVFLSFDLHLSLFMQGELHTTPIIIVKTHKPDELAWVDE